MEAQRVRALVQEPLAGCYLTEILSEVRALKAMTCPSDIPVDTLCCHEYGHEYSTRSLSSLSDGV